MTLLKTYVKKIDLPKEISDVLKILNDNGFEAYVAGGAVRNFLLGRKIDDYDITTNATPDKVKKLFKKSFDTGIKHGTVTVVTKNYNVEVTTYRVDKDYKDHRRPENVEFTKNLENDLARRDFTINALVYNPKEGIKDAFCGIEDLKAKRIKAVNDANLRFYEDALRILRGIRFSLTLGFEIEDSTLNAMNNNAKYLMNISVERIKEEFTKILLSEHFERIEAVLKTDVFKNIIPDIYNLDKDSILKIKSASNNSCVKWAVFIYLTNKKNCDEILRRYKFSNQEKKKIRFFIKNSDFAFCDDKVKLKLFMSENLEFIEDFNLYMKSLGKYFPYKLYKNVLKNKEPFNIKMLDIDGSDIKKIVSDDKIIGKVLQHLLDCVIENPDYNKKEKLKVKAEEYIWKLNHTQK
ncbi:MAG: CCA tRNA nucleotidyltransferase [Ruminococcaceae bacterium]|nr:CCA tRNA nucleotidyltransferase [Oscillospiraceae bacterium]